MLFKKHGWDVILKNIIVSVFWFLNGCFVLFNGGGTQMSAFRVGGVGVIWWEWATDWWMTYSVSVSLSKSLIDELWSVDADKQEVAFSYSTCHSMERQHTVCPPLCITAFFHQPPFCYITHPEPHCNVLFAHTQTHTHTPMNNKDTDRYRLLQTCRTNCTEFKTSNLKCFIIKMYSTDLAQTFIQWLHLQLLQTPLTAEWIRH